MLDTIGSSDGIELSELDGLFTKEELLFLIIKRNQWDKIELVDADVKRLIEVSDHVVPYM